MTHAPDSSSADATRRTGLLGGDAAALPRPAIRPAAQFRGRLWPGHSSRKRIAAGRLACQTDFSVSDAPYRIGGDAMPRLFGRAIVNDRSVAHVDARDHGANGITRTVRTIVRRIWSEAGRSLDSPRMDVSGRDR